MKLKQIFCVALALLMMTGCSHYRRASFQPAISTDVAQVSLVQTAQAINQSLHDLNQIKRATLPVGKKLVDIRRYAMPGHASVDWAGGVEPLLKKIVGMQHYKLVVLGQAPAIPVLVTISAQDKAVVDILRDIDLQAGDRASLRVLSARRVVELRYQRA